MSVKISVESIADEIETLLSANLNTKLAAIDANRGGGITCPTINSNAYFFQSLNEDIANYNPFVLYGLNNSETISEFGASAEILTFGVSLIIQDSGKRDLSKIMFRYRDALKEIFETNFYLPGSGVKIKVTSLMPMDLQGLNSSMPHKIIGILLEMSLG